MAEGAAVEARFKRKRHLRLPSKGGYFVLQPAAALEQACNTRHAAARGHAGAGDAPLVVCSRALVSPTCSTSTGDASAHACLVQNKVHQGNTRGGKRLVAG